MKLWWVLMQRQSRRGRCERDLIEAETAAAAIEIAQRENPGWIVCDQPVQAPIVEI